MVKLFEETLKLKHEDKFEWNIVLAIDEIAKLSSDQRISEVYKACTAFVNNVPNRWVFITALDMTPLIKIEEGMNGIFVSAKSGSGRPVELVRLPHPTFKEREEMFKGFFDQIRKTPSEVGISEEDLKVLLAYCGTHFRTLSSLFDIFQSTKLNVAYGFRQYLVELQKTSLLSRYNSVRISRFFFSSFFFKFVYR